MRSVDLLFCLRIRLPISSLSEAGVIERQRNDGGGCATMRERSERVESPGPRPLVHM